MTVILVFIYRQIRKWRDRREEKRDELTDSSSGQEHELPHHHRKNSHNHYKKKLHDLRGSQFSSNSRTKGFSTHVRDLSDLNHNESGRDHLVLSQRDRDSFQ